MDNDRGEEWVRRRRPKRGREGLSVVELTQKAKNYGKTLFWLIRDTNQLTFFIKVSKEKKLL